MKQKVKQLLLSKLVRASSWLLAGGVAGGILGYLFQIIMGRMLSVAEYGVLSSIMALYAIMSAPFQTLFMLVSRRVSVLKSQKNTNSIAKLFFVLNYKVAAISFILILIFWFLPFIKEYLLIENSSQFYLLIGILISTTFFSINKAYLQGLQYFKWLSASGVLSTLFKTIIAIIFVYFGFGVSGALGGVFISTLITLVLTYFILRPTLNKNTIGTSNTTRFLFKSASLAVLFANIAFVTMTQIDMVLVKYFFSEQDAGLYAAASILGKAVLYLPGGITMALFPMVAENHAKEKSSANLMFQAVSVTALLSLIGALFYYYFADYIILLLYGADYKEASIILKYFGFAILPMSLIMVAEYFLIAMGRVLFAYLFIILAPLQVIAIYYYHNTLLNIVMVLFVSGAVLVITGYGLLWSELRNGKTTEKL
ncbi:oligosaccharide flippase family protein [Methylophilaceae bacterium Uisw_099_01]